MSYDPNKEVLKTIKESKGPGEYMVQNYYKSGGKYTNSFGFGNSYNGKITGNTVDGDSFLKNLHIKNSRKIVYNPIIQEVNNKPSQISLSPSFNDTRVKKMDNKMFGVISYRQNVNQVLKNKVNYNIGMDSRHQNR